MCGGGRLHPDVVQDVPDVSAVRNERDDAHMTDESGSSTIEVSRWPVGAGPLNRIDAPPTRKID